MERSAPAPAQGQAVGRLEVDADLRVERIEVAQSAAAFVAAGDRLVQLLRERLFVDLEDQWEGQLGDQCTHVALGGGECFMPDGDRTPVEAKSAHDVPASDIVG